MSSNVIGAICLLAAAACVGVWAVWLWRKDRRRGNKH